jgi:cob(I)alamin adenosyltransferase
MKLYTKRGDDGCTDLFGGTRVPKDDVRVWAYGEVDETNAAIGVSLSSLKDAEVSAILRQVQSELFVLGAELATPAGRESAVAIGDAEILRLEQSIDHATAEVAPLRNFILPGGNAGAAALHLARTVCRRAERAVVSLAGREPVRPAVIIYLNRLSDLLFALARLMNHRTGAADVPWVSGAP